MSVAPWAAGTKALPGGAELTLTIKRAAREKAWVLVQMCAGCPGQLRSLGGAFSGGLLWGADLPVTSWRSGDTGEGCVQGRGLVDENAKELHSRTAQVPAVLGAGRKRDRNEWRCSGLLWS